MQELDGSSVQVKAQPGKGTLTDLRVVVYRKDPPSFPPSRTPKRAHQHPWQASRPLYPRLVAPVGAKLREGVSSSSLTNAQTSTLLKTDLVLSAIAVHYAAQFEQAGWTRTGEGSAGPGAWSTWTLQDEMQETWLGRFFLFQMPDNPQEYYLYLQVSWPHGNQDEWIG